VQWSFPSPLCVFVQTSIRRERYAAFKELAGKVAFAYRQHETRTPWSAYATVAGSSLQACILIPLNELRDMDSVLSLDRVMQDVYGDSGREILSEFQNCVSDMSTSILNQIDLGIDPPARTAPPQYLYYLNLNVRPSHAQAFLDGLRRAAKAVPIGPFAMFGTFAGQTRIHGFAMGDAIGDLGAIAPFQSQILTGFGREEGERIMSMLHEGLIETETAILRYIGHQDV
jgi:hypothetical protein